MSKNLPTPRDLTEAMRFAEVLSRSTMIPADYIDKPANVLIAIQWGYEIGLGPLQAMQSIAVINGRPSLWGDAALALVLQHPHYVSHREWLDGDGENRAGHCEITRRGGDPHHSVFTLSQARAAGLLEIRSRSGKPGPWQLYTDRMLVMRARGFALRDKFADALRGTITVEEARDYPAPDTQPPARAMLTSEPAAPPHEPAAAPPQALPLIAPDGRLLEAPHDRWLRWLEAALAKLESPAALSGWRREMAPLLSSMHTSGHGLLVSQAETMIATRHSVLTATEAVSNRDGHDEQEEVNT